MKARGELTPEKRAEYRAALDRLRAIERRHREPKSDGEKELHRIARWVLDRWTAGGPEAPGLSRRPRRRTEHSPMPRQNRVTPFGEIVAAPSGGR